MFYAAGTRPFALLSSLAKVGEYLLLAHSQGQAVFPDGLALFFLLTPQRTVSQVLLCARRQPDDDNAVMAADDSRSWYISSRSCGNRQLGFHVRDATFADAMARIKISGID